MFPTQESNPSLPHCRWILYHLSHQGSPWILKWVAYPFSRESSWPRIEPGSPALQADSWPAELPGNPWCIYKCLIDKIVFCSCWKHIIFICLYSFWLYIPEISQRLFKSSLCSLLPFFSFFVILILLFLMESDSSCRVS